MFFFIAILSLVPLGAFAVSRRWSDEKIPWPRTAGWMLGLFAVGLSVASPFLTKRAVGTGEAYNYSLALADAVTQLRAGEIPPLVGQTEFAFNGRVHPLRNAPYLSYLAGALDVLSFHRLDFWELQNLSLALSLVAVAFAAYGSLRWGIGCSRPRAFLLAAVYTYCPALLNACTVNLYMTVHAAVFVPIAIGACLRHCRQATPVNDIVFAAAVAATWLAHPPVACWLTGCLAFVRVIILWHHPNWKTRAGLAAALIMGALLAGFVFVSVATMNSDLGFFTEGSNVRQNYVVSVMESLSAGWPGSLLPVSRMANRLTDFQFGYASWLLLGITLFLTLRPRPPGDAGATLRRRAALGLAALILLLVVLCLPIPWFTRQLWLQVPIAVQSMTSIWPMQRLYLVASGLAVFAAALVCPTELPRSGQSRKILLVAVVLGAGWTLFEGSLFIARGFGLRWPKEMSARSHLPSNLDLTVISYAFLGTPATFVHGVMDPEFEFRLLKNGRREVDSPLKAALATAPVVAQGDLARRDDGSGVVESARLTLQPGQRYLLTFNFLTPPARGLIEMIGPALSRHYALPSAGSAEGFGMESGHRHSISVWTALPHPEEIELRFTVFDWPATVKPGAVVANFTLQAVDSSHLPVQLNSLLPLRCTVESAEAGCYLATPRRFISGYAASVNGLEVTPIASPEGDVMVPVPRGHSVVELRYVGARILRAAFWVSALGWSLLAIWFAGLLVGIDWNGWAQRVFRRIAPTLQWSFRHKFLLLATATVGIAVTIGWSHRRTYLTGVGPVRISFLLPQKQTGRQQPLLVTGRTGAGTIVFVDYVDDDHVRIGADIWGMLYQTNPLPADYFQQQVLVVSSSGLYPLDHPVVQALSASDREQLRREIRIEFNGHPALTIPRFAYESTLEEVTCGETRIGGSMTQSKFVGKILNIERLPIPQSLVITRDEDIGLKVDFPTRRTGFTEPLLAVGPNGAEGICAATYQADGLLRLTYRAADGTVIDSRALECDLARHHELEFAFGDGPDAAHHFAVSWKLDGRHVLGPEALVPRSLPCAVTTGFSPVDLPEVEARFTGRELIIAPLARRSVGVAKEITGPLRLTLTLPKNKIGRPEPLVTTGHTGKGDFAYVVYVDAQHVRFGLDHWGIGGAVSEPIAIDYSSPHEVEIRFGSFYPPETDQAWLKVDAASREQMKKKMEILLDGQSVLRAPLAAHPTTADEITVGLNRIGGSNCDESFSGTVHSVERAGLPR